MTKKIFVSNIAVFITALICQMPHTICAQGSGVDDWGFGTETKAVQNEVQTPPVSYDAQTTDYVIKQGDCLWNLAFTFLGNPFQWPQIWQNNTYIKNPDLIYPGDILKIPGRGSSPYTSAGSFGETVSGLQQSAQNNPEFTSRTAELLNTTSSQKESADVGIFNSDSPLLSIIRSKDHLGGSFFKAIPFLWFTRNSSGVLMPGESVIDAPPENAMYQLYDKIQLSIKNNELYKVGDSVDIYNYFRVIEHNKARATIVKCVGSVKLTEIMKNKASGLLYKVYDKVVGGEHLMKAEPLKSQEIDTLVSPDVAIQATLITRAEETESPYVFQTLIIDKGSQDGVRVGDVFAMYRVNDGVMSKNVAMTGYTANVQQTTSSLSIIKMSDNKLSPGDKGILFRRTVFKGGGKN
ncbi:MAG: LysM peptidoglycan-binding domain-containing protein [Fibrobacterota bacterium]